MTDDRAVHEAWPQRAIMLLALGALLGLAFHTVTGHGNISWTTERLRLAGAAFIAGAGLSFAFTLERRRWLWSLLFGLGCGLVMAGVTYWNGDAESWRVPSLLLAVAIAAPLFQVVRDEGRWNLAQRPIHAHAWTNVVLWFAVWLFVLIVVLLTWLVAALFSLIGIDFLRELVGKGWFIWMLIGASLGAAVGLLRDRDQVLGVLQRVVTLVLSMLTPFLAIGLGLFILSLPVTGLEPLWQETSATTPILLGCAIVAILFTNATIGNSLDEEAQNPILRYGALVLAIVVLPLAIVAAVSTGLRIDQYGLTPDRLWAATFILVACAYGIAYAAAIPLGRTRWPDRVRQLNVWLALGLCGLALLLATPIVDFGALSTRDQLARLENGKVSADQFDWRVLAFDFGPSGKEALRRLQRSGKTAEIRAEAGKAIAAKGRWELLEPSQRRQQSAMLAKARILPEPAPLPDALKDMLMRSSICANRPCTIYHDRDSDRAVIISQPDCSEPGRKERRTRPPPVLTAPPGRSQGLCDARVDAFYRHGDRWTETPPPVLVPGGRARNIDEGWARGDVEVREVPRKQIFVGGEPVGQAFD